MRKEINGLTLADWWHSLPQSNTVQCDLCPRFCKLKSGERGFCFVRENRDGQLILNTYGRSTGFCVDPIEKKPLNHFLPGSSVLSFGTAGCNLACQFCQNWSISKSREIEMLSEKASPAQIACMAKDLGCRSVAFTYNDPVIWAEYAIDTAIECRNLGLKTVAVTAGYINPEARQKFFEVMDAANVDLKGFTENFYRKNTASHLQPVLDTLEWLHKDGKVWLEITNLIIPGENDCSSEIESMCAWIVDHLGKDVPLHFTAFHPDYRMMHKPPTPEQTLLQAREIAVKAGIHYVYLGNILDLERESTYCQRCKNCLVERFGYHIGSYCIKDSVCSFCKEPIPGVWENEKGDWTGQRMRVRSA